MDNQIRKPQALFLSHLGMGDMIVMCGAVRYLRTVYREVVVVCKDRYFHNVKMMYQDDHDIRLLQIDSSLPEEPIIKHIVQEHSDCGTYDLYLCGLHKSLIYGTPYSDNCNIHRMFYNDMNLDISLMKSHFLISSTDESSKLLQIIPSSMKIIFVHNCASNQEVYIPIERYKNENTIIINPNKNMYHHDDLHYNLANQFLDMPLLAYTDIMKQADEIHVTDSSFSCLAGCLLQNNTKENQKRFLYTRTGHNYPDLFDSSWTYLT
jgi:hypothetical protein